MYGNNITTLDVRTLNNVRAEKNVQPTQQNIFNNFPHCKSYEVQVTFLFFLIFYRKREREGIAVATVSSVAILVFNLTSWPPKAPLHSPLTEFNYHHNESFITCFRSNYQNVPFHSLHRNHHRRYR